MYGKGLRHCARNELTFISPMTNNIIVSNVHYHLFRKFLEILHNQQKLTVNENLRPELSAFLKYLKKIYHTM